MIHLLTKRISKALCVRKIPEFHWRSHKVFVHFEINININTVHFWMIMYCTCTKVLTCQVNPYLLCVRLCILSHDLLCFKTLRNREVYISFQQSKTSIAKNLDIIWQFVPSAAIKIQNCSLWLQPKTLVNST